MQNDRNKKISYYHKKKWDLISVDEVIKRSNLNKKNFIGKIRSKKDLLKNINRFFDMDIKKILKNEDQSNQKDMIFEIMMMRFDCLLKYRKSIINSSKKIINYMDNSPYDFIVNHSSSLCGKCIHPVIMYLVPLFKISPE